MPNLDDLDWWLAEVSTPGGEPQPVKNGLRYSREEAMRAMAARQHFYEGQRCEIRPLPAPQTPADGFRVLDRTGRFQCEVWLMGLPTWITEPQGEPDDREA